MVLKWLFGRAQPQSAAARPDRTQKVGRYPWQPQSEIRGNLAIGALRESLLNWASDERGVHVETLAVAVGALTGFAGQNAALARAEAATRSHGHAGQDDIVLVQDTSGVRYIYGDGVNRALIGDAATPLALWNLVCGAAVSAGVTEDRLPDFTALAGQAAARLGSPAFDQVDTTPNLRPHLTPKQALAKYWAATEGVMRQPLPSPGLRDPPLDEEHWPIIASLVAGQLLTQAKDALDPAVTARVIVEAAIIASKTDPEAVTPGRWKLEPGPDGIRVFRA